MRNKTSLVTALDSESKKLVIILNYMKSKYQSHITS